MAIRYAAKSCLACARRCCAWKVRAGSQLRHRSCSLLVLQLLLLLLMLLLLLLPLLLLLVMLLLRGGSNEDV